MQNEYTTRSTSPKRQISTFRTGSGLRSMRNLPIISVERRSCWLSRLQSRYSFNIPVFGCHALAMYICLFPPPVTLPYCLIFREVTRKRVFAASGKHFGECGSTLHMFQVKGGMQANMCLSFIVHTTRRRVREDRANGGSCIECRNSFQPAVDVRCYLPA
jgi:hypothetical protein